MFLFKSKVINANEIIEPLLWLNTANMVSSGSTIVDIEKGTIAIDYGTMKAKVIIFHISKKIITFNDKTYNFDDVVDIVITGMSRIIIKFKDNKNIKFPYEFYNEGIDKGYVKNYRENFTNCLKMIVMENKGLNVKLEDSYVYIDETLEDYQRWINSIDCMLTGSEVVNTMFLQNEGFAKSIQIEGPYKITAKKTLVNLKKIKDDSLFELLLYSRDVKNLLLINKVSVKKYWSYKKELFNIIQKRYTSFEQLSSTYLEERKQYVDVPEDNDELNEKIKLINNLLTNDLSVWKKLSYDISL